MSVAASVERAVVGLQPMPERIWTVVRVDTPRETTASFCDELFPRAAELSPDPDHGFCT